MAIVEAKAQGVLSVNLGNRIGEFPFRNKRTAVGVPAAAYAVKLRHAHARICLLQRPEFGKDAGLGKVRRQRSRRGNSALRRVGREIAKAEVVHSALAHIDGVRNLPGFPLFEIRLCTNNWGAGVVVRRVYVVGIRVAAKDRAPFSQVLVAAIGLLVHRQRPRNGLDVVGNAFRLVGNRRRIPETVLDGSQAYARREHGTWNRRHSRLADGIVRHAVVAQGKQRRALGCSVVRQQAARQSYRGPVDGLIGKRGISLSREISRQDRRVRDGLCQKLTVIHAPAFVVGHPERLVAPVIQVRNVDRTIRYEPKLVQVQNREAGGGTGDVGVGLGKRQCVEPVFAVGFEQCAVQLVAAALADHVDLARGESILGRIDAALDLELLDCILRKNHGWCFHGLVGVDQTVQREVVALRTATVDADGVAFALTHGTLFAADRDRAGAQKQQLNKVAAIQREFFYLLLAYQLRQRRAIGVQFDGLRRHFHGFCHRARLQRQVDADLLVDCQYEAGRDRLLKTLDLG